MSSKNIARRTAVEVTLDGVDITKSLRQYFVSLTFTDTDSSNDEDAVDDLQIRLQDADGIWVETWLGQAIDAAASPRTQNGIYTVTAKSGLNVRAEPSIKGKKLGAFPQNTEVYVNTIADGWADIEYNNRTAYVSAAYIKPAGSESRAVSTGLEIGAVIVRQNWNGDGADDVFDCGVFELDSIDCSGSPAEITIKGTALPFHSRIRQSKHSQAWESYNLEGIGYEIASRNGMICMFSSAHNPFYERVEQYQVSDIAFLNQLCQDAGCALKATNKMIVIFDRSEYGKKPIVRTVKRGDGSYTRYKLRSSSAGTQYQSCRVFYNTVSGNCIEGIAYCDDYDADRDDNQQLEICHKVTSIAEAKTLAEKYLRLHNRYEKTVQFTMPGDPALCAGCNLSVQGWGAWDGKYHITKVNHTVGTSGYTSTVDAVCEQ